MSNAEAHPAPQDEPRTIEGGLYAIADAIRDLAYEIKGLGIRDVFNDKGAIEYLADRLVVGLVEISQSEFAIDRVADALENRERGR